MRSKARGQSINPGHPMTSIRTPQRSAESSSGVKTAKALGFIVLLSLLGRADEVIE